MAQHPKTTPTKIIAGLALLTAGYNGTQLGRYLNLDRWRTDEIEEIYKKAERELQNDTVWIEAAKMHLTKGFLQHAAAALIQSADTLTGASALQAATIAGIATDKALALTGKAPQQAPQTHLHLHVTKQLEEIESKLKMLTSEPEGGKET